MNDEYNNIFMYVDSAAQLAESLAAEIRNGTKMSPETVTALNKFITTHQAMVTLLDKTFPKHVQYN